MRFTVEGKEFQQRLAAVSKVINAKNAMSILDNFLLKLEGDRLSIMGSDSENVLTTFIEVMDNEGEGAVAINAKRLLEIVKEISNQPLTFYINEETNEIDLRFLSGHFNFMGTDAKQYPLPRQAADDAMMLIIPTEMILDGIQKTLYAVSPETVRPIMMGICVDIHNDDITFVSSDTHKLVRYINRTKAPEMEATFILPAKPAGILSGIIGKDDTDVKVTFDKKGATFEVGDYMLSCLFINGNYPNYNRVIPASTPFELTVDRVSLLGALRRVALFASKSSGLIVMELEGNSILLTGRDLDYSTSAEERVSCTYEGNNMTVGFNGNFMIEILNNIKDDSVVIGLTDPACPAVYRPLTQEAAQDLTVIQMPMQVM